MKLLPFKDSDDLSLGVELEYQIVSDKSGNLTSGAKELIRSVIGTRFEPIIKPEITQSMLEFNSTIHTTPQTIKTELRRVRRFLLKQAEDLNINFCGGGTHPFQKWSARKIFPIKRYHKLSKHYQYLSKRATVFGMHVHVGCSSAEKALYLTHALARFIPHFIALSASSPFYQGVDSGFDSTRITVFNMFPFSGAIPYLTTWRKFSEYFYELKNLGLIETMKDAYWDVRPKPEFGTVEIRVFDTPLTLDKVTMIVAFVQTLSYFLLEERPYKLTPKLYLLLNFNRFQGARYGLSGVCTDPYTLKPVNIRDDILETLKLIMPYAKKLNTTKYLLALKNEVTYERNDTLLLREFYAECGSLKDVVKEQCRLWKK